MLEHNKSEVLDQIRSWEEDMREMVESAFFCQKAESVLPFHKENQNKVRKANVDIQKSAMELLQALHNHQLEDLRDRQNRNVVETVNRHIKELKEAERHVMRYAEETLMKIQAAVEVNDLGRIANGVCKLIDNQLGDLNRVIPNNYHDTLQKEEELRKYREAVQNRLKEPYDIFVARFRELMENPLANRDEIVNHNELILTKYRRLMAICEERNKLLRAAHGCYKTYETAVMPILNQLESEYRSPAAVLDWCTTCPSSLDQDRAAYMADLISKHMNYKERFTKGCSYALRNGDFLLRYIRRANVPNSER